jgi:hypothetical protein
MTRQTKSFDSAYPQSNGNTVTGGFTKREIMALEILANIMGGLRGTVNAEDVVSHAKSAVHTADILIMALNTIPELPIDSKLAI